MAAKRKKAKKRKARLGKLSSCKHRWRTTCCCWRRRRENAEGRWSRPRKRRISLRVDIEVVDWFKSKGPGYQTRINRILRRVMSEGKKRVGEK